MGHSGAGTYRAGVSHGQSHNAGIGRAGGDLTAANLSGVLSVLYVLSRTTALAAASQGTGLSATGGPAACDHGQAPCAALPPRDSTTPKTYSVQFFGSRLGVT